MLRFLSSLFALEPQTSAGPDEALVEKAIDRVVAGTDQRLCALGQYRKRLRKPVRQAIVHVIDLIDALAPPLELNPKAFCEDARLRAFFVSPDHLRDVLGGFRSVRSYIEETEQPSDAVIGLLLMEREERRVFGMEIEDGRLRRDVEQVAVNFFNHRYLCPTCDESVARTEIKKRAFDFLIQKTLERLMDERGKRRELNRQRTLLKQKLRVMKSGGWGLEPTPDDRKTDNGSNPDLAALEEEIQSIETELGEFRTDAMGLEESLACVIDTLSHPEDWLGCREITLSLDARGIKVADADPEKALILTEIFSRTGERMIVTLGAINRRDIPDPQDIWKNARCYL